MCFKTEEGNREKDDGIFATSGVQLAIASSKAQKTQKVSDMYRGGAPVSEKPLQQCRGRAMTCLFFLFGCRQLYPLVPFVAPS